MKIVCLSFIIFSLIILIPTTYVFAQTIHNPHSDMLNVTIPKGWRIVHQEAPSYGMYPILTIAPPLSQDPNATTDIEILKQNNSSFTNIQLLLQSVIESYTKNAPKFKLLSSTLNTTMSGYPAYKLYFYYNDPKFRGPEKTMEIATIIGKITYVYDYYAAAESFNKFLPEAQTIVRSISLAAK